MIHLDEPEQFDSTLESILEVFPAYLTTQIEAKATLGISIVNISKN